MVREWRNYIPLVELDSVGYLNAVGGETMYKSPVKILQMCIRDRHLFLDKETVGGRTIFF